MNNVIDPDESQAAHRAYVRAMQLAAAAALLTVLAVMPMVVFAGLAIDELHGWLRHAAQGYLVLLPVASVLYTTHAIRHPRVRGQFLPPVAQS